jgi:hypothetical protein
MSGDNFWEVSGDNSKEKHEPSNDIETVAMERLKALDL